MTAAILLASTIAALAAVGGIAYQAYIRRPAFAVLGGSTTPEQIDFNIRNIGSTAAQNVLARAQIEGTWYDVQQGAISVIAPDDAQPFSCHVPGALQKDLGSGLVEISYDGALGRRWTRIVALR